MQSQTQTPGPAGISFPPKSLDILKLISERGGMLCTGSCHHQKPGQLHCRQIGKALEMGFSTVWERVNFLIREGLVEREKIEDGPVNFAVTRKGRELLALTENTGP